MFVDFNNFNASTCKAKVGTVFEHGADTDKLVMFAYLSKWSCYGYATFDASQTKSWPASRTPTETWYHVVGPSGSTNSGGTSSPITTAPLNDLVLKGALTLNVADADAFLSDFVAMGAIKKGIAKTLAVTRSQVLMTTSKMRRLAVGDSTNRNLVSVAVPDYVEADYTVTVPASSGAKLQSSVKNLAMTATRSTFTMEIQAEVAKVKGANYTVLVPSMTAVTSSYVTPDSNDDLDAASSAVGCSQTAAAISMLVSMTLASF